MIPSTEFRKSPVITHRIAETVDPIRCNYNLRDTGLKSNRMTTNLTLFMLLFFFLETTIGVMAAL